MQREVTARQASMPGVTVASFVCRCCGRERLAHGRRQIVKGTSRFGYKCAECVEDGK